MNSNAGCISKVVSSWQCFIDTLNIKHPIHPLDPIAPENSEFFLIDAKTRIRLIHISPENGPRRYSFDVHQKHHSLTEEYWFTKWNKPLKVGICSCSFRRSQRYYAVSKQLETKQEEHSPQSNFDVAPKQIINVETFVERIIQETIFEAFQEYYVLQVQSKVVEPVSYPKTANNDEEVVLRKKQFVVSKQPRNCFHKKNIHKKPLIILFHGIGSSSDVWWPILASLVNKGYEVIAPDMLGHGYSSAPNQAHAYTFHNLLLHAITVFDHYVSLDDKRKCILIGHSYGCSLITALYRHRSSHISELVLISGGGPTPLAAPVTNNEISPFGVVHTLFKPLLFCGMKRSFLFSSRGKHFDACDQDSGVPQQILSFISQGQNWAEGDAAFHRRILVPTLLVHGLQDKQVTLVQQCEMERTIPRAFLELIPNAGHMAMLETPEHLSHMILCFIETWT